MAFSFESGSDTPTGHLSISSRDALPPGTDPDTFRFKDLMRDLVPYKQMALNDYWISPLPGYIPLNGLGSADMTLDIGGTSYPISLNVQVFDDPDDLATQLQTRINAATGAGAVVTYEPLVNKIEINIPVTWRILDRGHLADAIGFVPGGYAAGAHIAFKQLRGGLRWIDVVSRGLNQGSRPGVSSGTGKVDAIARICVTPGEASCGTIDNLNWLPMSRGSDNRPDITLYDNYGNAIPRSIVDFDFTFTIQ